MLMKVTDIKILDFTPAGGVRHEQEESNHYGCSGPGLS